MFHGSNDNWFFSGQECAPAPLSLRQIPTRVLVALSVLQRLDCPPQLIRDRNGRGQRFLKLRYRTPDGREHSQYVGYPKPNIEALLRHAITERWPLTKREWRIRIKTLRAERQTVRLHAQKLAAASGYYFRGHLLFRRMKVL